MKNGPKTAGKNFSLINDLSKKTAMKAEYNRATPYIKSMVSCLSKVVDDGYKEDFIATREGLESSSTRKLYGPNEVKVVTSFRFEGFSDPHDSAVLYVIETSDGIKGTLIDGCGNLSDPFVYKFILDVESRNERIMIN
jgi:hypothetical protein